MRKTKEEICALGKNPEKRVRRRAGKDRTYDEEGNILSETNKVVQATYAYCLIPLGEGVRLWVNADDGYRHPGEEELATHLAYKIGLDKDEPYSKGGGWPAVSR